MDVRRFYVVSVEARRSSGDVSGQLGRLAERIEERGNLVPTQRPRNAAAPARLRC
jgi:hypothetical protein